MRKQLNGMFITTNATSTVHIPAHDGWITATNENRFRGSYEARALFGGGTTSVNLGVQTATDLRNPDGSPTGICTARTSDGVQDPDATATTVNVNAKPISPSAEVDGLMSWYTIPVHEVPLQFRPSDPVSTQWLDETPHEVTVHSVHQVDDGPGRPAEIHWAASYVDGRGPVLVRLEGESFSPIRAKARTRPASRARWVQQVRFDPDGIPLEEQTFGPRHESAVTFQSFDRCTVGEPIAPHDFAAGTVFTDETDLDGTESVAALLARAQERAASQQLLDDARLFRTFGLGSVLLAGLSGTAAVTTKEGEFERGALVGQTVALGTVGVSELVLAWALSRQARKRLKSSAAE